MEAGGYLSSALFVMTQSKSGAIVYGNMGLRRNHKVPVFLEVLEGAVHLSGGQYEGKRCLPRLDNAMTIE